MSLIPGPPWKHWHLCNGNVNCFYTFPYCSHDLLKSENTWILHVASKEILCSVRRKMYAVCHSAECGRTWRDLVHAKAIYWHAPCAIRYSKLPVCIDTWWFLHFTIEPHLEIVSPRNGGWRSLSPVCKFTNPKEILIKNLSESYSFFHIVYCHHFSLYNINFINVQCRTVLFIRVET